MALGGLARKILGGIFVNCGIGVDFADVRKIFRDRRWKWQVLHEAARGDARLDLGRALADRIARLGEPRAVLVSLNHKSLGLGQFSRVIEGLTRDMHEEIEILIESNPFPEQEDVLEITVLCALDKET